MNTIKIENEENKIKIGSIWKSTGFDKNHYILTRVSIEEEFQYVCVGLEDGVSWGEPSLTKAEAVDGLKLYAKEAKIKIKKKK